MRSKGESEKENGGGERRRRKRRRRFCRGGDIKEKFSSVQFREREGGRKERSNACPYVTMAHFIVIFIYLLHRYPGLLRSSD